MRQNIAIMTLFLSGLQYTEAVVSKTDHQKEASANITLAELSDNIKLLDKKSEQNMLALNADISAPDDPVDEEAEADADATDENNIPEPPLPAGNTREIEARESPGAQAPSTPASINSEDAKCYASRYQDIDALLDPKSHYATVGIQQGRLGTCARRLTDIEAQRYLNANPELQRQFGRTGVGSLQQAREHWQNIGYKVNAYIATVTDKDNLPFRCAASSKESCMCPGTLWFGPSVRPDNGAKIDTFEEMREWRTLSAESEDWQSCSAVEFGSDPMPGTDKQCFCEIKPAYEANRCADEGDDCLCNGHVYFAPRNKHDHSTPANFMDILGDDYTLVDANGTGTVSCTSDSFEGADPLPEYAKQCFCDDRKTFTSVSEMYSIQDYYRSESVVHATEYEMETVMATEYEVEQQEYGYEYEDVYEYEFEEVGSSHYSSYGGSRGGRGGRGRTRDLPRGGRGRGGRRGDKCAICEETCHGDSDRYMSQELDRSRNMLRRKYSKMRDTNKYRRVTARNKMIAGDNYCTQSQRAKDPAEKKKLRKLCYELRSESSRIITETDIELQNIEDMQKNEEKIINEETTKITNEKNEKTIINEQTTDINEAKITEETSSRITKETEERINIIKKIIETEKITESIITSETTNIEKEITNINKQIEETENQLTKEIKDERDENNDGNDDVNENVNDLENELKDEVKNKKDELTSKKEKITSKIEELTSKVTELESTIETVTKKITNIKIEIENITEFISTTSKQRDVLESHIENMNKEQSTSIQEMIDSLTSKIESSRESLINKTKVREELIVQETTARTELTFTSQSLKKAENYESHIEEQIVVTNVVIKSKEEKIEEDTTKKEITQIQHNCFMKKLFLQMQKESFKQWKANINKKISKKRKELEDARNQLRTTQEELTNAKSNLATLEYFLSKTTTDGQKTVIQGKITVQKAEITKLETSITTYNTTVVTLTKDVEDMVSGKTTTEKQEEIDKLEEETNKIMMESVMKLMMLPLIQMEVGGGSSTSIQTATHHCGVITGLTIKGDIGGSSTSTSTSTTDINTQIIEKEDYAQKMREEFTKISEIAKIQREEINESINSSKKVLEDIQKLISESKIHLTEMRQKEKEINTKITSSTESSEIETYKHELTSITNQITTIKKTIKEETQKKVQTESKITEEINKIKEIDNRVDTSENDSNSATDEALNYITEGIEATYVIQKHAISENKTSILKNKESEYKETKKKYEEEKIIINKQITEEIIKTTNIQNEISDLSKRIENDESRLEKVTKDEEKTVIKNEISSFKSEMEKYQKMMELMQLQIAASKQNQTVINQNFNNYYHNYTTTKADAFNSIQESKEYERWVSERHRHKHSNHTHISNINSYKKKAETHRHATEETKKKVTKQEKHFKSQRYNLRCERSRHEHNSKTYTKEVTIEEKKIIELRKKIEITKDESERIKIQDEITSLEASIETYKNNIKTEISKMHKTEEEETNISNKITSIQETVKKLEEETIRIEEEARTVENSTTSETAKKVTKEVHKIKKHHEDIHKQQLHEKIKRLEELMEKKEKKVEENTIKIIDRTRLITQNSNNLNRFTMVNQRQQYINRVAVCQRMIIEQPTYFDVTTMCNMNNNAGMFGGNNNGVNGGAGGRGTGGLTQQSQTCQACYALNPSCSSGGASSAGVSVISFSVDSQGEADMLINAMMQEGLIADVNFVSALVNRKFSLYGQVTSDPSQVRVEVITSDAKSQSVIGRVTQWRNQNGKSVQGLENDAVQTTLTGATPDYVAYVLRQLGGGRGGMAGGMGGGMMAGGMGGGMMAGGMAGGMMAGGMMGGGMARGGMAGGMMGGGMMAGGMGGGMMGGGMSTQTTYTVSNYGGGMGGFHMAQTEGPQEDSDDLSRPSENNRVETMQNFVSGFY